MKFGDFFSDKLLVRHFSLSSIQDVEPVLNSVREPNVVLVINIGKPSAYKFYGFKRVLEEIKRVSDISNKQIVGVEDSMILISPRSAKLKKDVTPVPRATEKERALIKEFERMEEERLYEKGFEKYLKKIISPIKKQGLTKIAEVVNSKIKTKEKQEMSPRMKELKDVKYAITGVAGVWKLSKVTPKTEIRKSEAEKKITERMMERRRKIVEKIKVLKEFFEDGLISKRFYEGVNKCLFRSLAQIDHLILNAGGGKDLFKPIIELDVPVKANKKKNKKKKAKNRRKVKKLKRKAGGGKRKGKRRIKKKSK